MERVKEDGGEAGQFATSQTFGAGVGQHVLRNGVRKHEATSENLMSNVAPSDTEVS